MKKKDLLGEPVAVSRLSPTDGLAISRFTSLSGCLIPLRHVLPPAPPLPGVFFVSGRLPALRAPQPMAAALLRARFLLGAQTGRRWRLLSLSGQASRQDRLRFSDARLLQGLKKVARAVAHQTPSAPHALRAGREPAPGESACRPWTTGHAAVCRSARTSLSICTSSSVRGCRLSMIRTRPRSTLAVAQIGGKQALPLRPDFLGSLGKAIARQVNEVLAVRESEIVQVLGSSRRLGDKSQSRMIGQRVDRRRLAGVRTPGKGDFALRIAGQITQIGDRRVKNGLLEIEASMDPGVDG
jgi:pyrimidine operon attenuation protein/uracil phosphoribosyltransferase